MSDAARHRQHENTELKDGEDVSTNGTHAVNLNGLERPAAQVVHASRQRQHLTGHRNAVVNDEKQNLFRAAAQKLPRSRSRSLYLKLTVLIGLFFVVTSCLVVTILKTPHGRLEQQRFVQNWVEEAKVEDRKAHAYRLQIHQRFGIPEQILSAMPYKDVRKLLDRLVEIARESTVEMPSVVMLHCVSDFEARMEALGSALSYAINTNRLLLVLWETDRDFAPRSFGKTDSAAKSSVDADSDWAAMNTLWFDPLTDPKPHKSQHEKLLDESRLFNRHIFLTSHAPVPSKYAPSGHARRLLQDFEPKSLALSAMKMVRNGHFYGDLNSTQVSATLHRDYAVPLDFLVGMSTMDRARLLDELMRLQTQVSQPRCLFIHVQFGLGNRLRALGSAMAFAERTHRALVVFWENDFHFNATFHDFFVNDLIIVDQFHAKWPFDRTRDNAFSSLMAFNHMRKDGKGTISASVHHLEDTIGNHIYIKTAYIIKSAQTGSDNPKAKNAPTNAYMRQLIPNVEVQREVDRLEIHNLRSMIGVHVRSKSAESEMQKVDARKEYTEEGRSTVNFWRKKTQLHVFVQEMHRREALHKKKFRYFIAADDPVVVLELDKLFPGRIYNVPRQCDDRNAQCLRYALIDVLCLSRTQFILGSFWSSFTEAAARIGGQDVYFAGVDFASGKKKNN